MKLNNVHEEVQKQAKMEKESNKRHKWEEEMFAKT